MSERRTEAPPAGPVATVRNRLGNVAGCLPMGCLSVLGFLFICIAPFIGMAAMGWLDFLK